MKMREKKGVLGLNTVKLVLIIFLVLSVIAVTIILTTVNLRDVLEKIDLDTGNEINETFTPDASGANLTPATGDFQNRVCTISFINNETAVIVAANYSETNCIVTNLTDHVLGVWNATYTWSYSSPTTRNIERNITEGLTDFFSNTGTIFSILIVVVIILTIAIIIAVVSRVGGGAGIRRAGGAGRESGTLMGI